MGNVHMEASQINYRGGAKKMSVEEALKEGSGSIASEIIAPEFSATAQYLTGDLVFYEDTLYRFETDHDPGEWDSTEVMASNIAENLVMFPGDGLQRTIHEFSVKLKAEGGLHFDANGAIYSDHLPDYSLTENKTGRQWIDGKDIYFKVFDVGLLPDTTEKRVASGLTNITPVNIYGITYGTNEPTPIPIIAWSTNLPVVCYFGYNTTTNEFVIISNSNFGTAGMKAYVVMEYTKTE